ncbi:hypothetical protein Nos7524_1350 [Nostoc sp. PCC 7524]|uniref:hypothetical protein n=1 Tax=Nostoc sp. (strain ATCC 29411 / PCC 7524) TaxID=28072 RepID=UPI00029F13CC|nr:hypothetical protein [Nostoc sp. PCC 7524]AFY47230.1 hypothetical protein Nos7524_1350 [Nostoc sp. PCC 7524]
MNKDILVLHELNIAIATQNHSPSVLTFDFLKYGGIVPLDWQLARQPIVSNQGSQLIFDNGLSIVAQPQVLNFVELISAKQIQEIEVPGIIHKYINALPKVEYQAIGINLKGYVTESQLGVNTTTHNYIHNLLAPASWQEIGNTPVKASVQLAFTLDRCQFSLGINEGNFYLSEQETVPIVLFSGNFSYGIADNSQEERLQSLNKLLDNWATDIETYQEIINSHFLKSSIILRDAPEELTSEVLISR